MRPAILRIISVLLLTAAAIAFAESPPPPDPFAAHVSRAGPRTPEDECKGFHVPPGFEVQLVAAEPYVRKPINMNFDDRGRLWVTESVEYPFPAAAGKQHRDTVRVLEDTDGNGRADEVTTFADGLNIPIGVLPDARGAIVYSIPNVYRIEDTDDDGRADRREVLLSGFGYKDTHGMTGEFTRGFDGWIYACHGFANDSRIVARDGSSITMSSGSTYRFRPDGSHVEAFTRGQVNPFGLTFDPLGNLYSCDCHSRPIYMLLRGAYYPSFGKPHDGLGFGPEMMTHDHGSTAIAGITYYAADHFPPEYRDTIFIGNVVTNRINHDRLERHGSSYQAIALPDFLSSDDPWFRPVDIKLGPDGALYVADFYNRIIGHYEVPLDHPGRDRHRGRIWRIVYRGFDGKGNPRPPRKDWTIATIDQLVGDLADPNLVVRRTAMQQLIERGGGAGIEALRRAMQIPSRPLTRMHGLWILERCGVLDAVTLVAALSDPDRGVRVHALKVLAERSDLSAPLRALAMVHLHDPDAFARRAAADALGRHPSAVNVRPLLALRHSVPADDTHLLHVVRMALRDQLGESAAWRSLDAEHWSERDQRALADVAPGVPTPDAARFLLHHLQWFSEPRENQVRYVYHIARYGPNLTTALLELARGDRGAPLSQQVAVFKAIQEGLQARGSSLPTAAGEWGESLARQLLSAVDNREFIAGIELGGLLGMRSLRPFFQALAEDRTAAADRRQTTLDALTALDPDGAIPLLGRIMSDPAESLVIRLRAARLLGNTNRPEAQAVLGRGLPTAPERLARSIAYGLAVSAGGAEQLLQAVSAGKASAHLLQDRSVEMRMQLTRLPKLQERVARLTRDLPSAGQQYEEIIIGRRIGYLAARADPAAGARVFEKHCAICHQLANKGARIGPQLDGIGARGLDRLLEDIIDPSRNVDQAFRLTTLGLNNGQIVSGLLLREEGKVLVVADSQGKEVRVPLASVEDRTLSQLSPMPNNVLDQIPERDFYHLMAFLLGQQPSKAATATNGTGAAHR